MNFYEKIDTDNARDFLSMDNNQIVQLFFEEDWYNEDGEIIKPITHIKEVKKYITTSLKNQGVSYIHYNQVSKGRFYATTMSLQGMAGSIRNFLLNNGIVDGQEIYDYDMEKAHTQLLRFFAKELEIKTPYLKSYLKKRDKILEHYNINKRDVLMTMNLDKNRSKNDFLIKFHEECMNIKNKLIKQEKYSDIIPTTNKKNPISSKANKILCYIENEILQNVIKNISITTPIFDGFHSIEKLDLEKLNSLNEYGIKWAVKKMEKYVDISNIENNAANYYEIAKEIFERNVFKLDNPSCFIFIDDEKKIHQKNGNDIIHIMEDKIIDYKKQDGEDGDFNDFFKEWKKDPEKRAFKKMDFRPALPPMDNKDFYNTFIGFNFTKQDEIKNTGKTDIFHEYFEKISNEPGVGEYVKKYIADIIQNPERRPDVALGIRGLQGTGKDSLVQLTMKGIGSRYCEYNVDMCDIQHRFNSNLEAKILIHVDETEAKDQKQGKMKMVITAEKKRIERKGFEPIFEKNMSRYIFTSNDNYFLDIDADDRRFFIFKMDDKLKNDTDFWNKFYKSLNDQEIIDEFFTELSKMDLSNFQPKLNRPETSQKKMMSENKVRPQHAFLYEKILDELNENLDETFKFFNSTKKENIYTFNFTNFSQELKSYYKNNNLNLREGKEIDPKHIKVLMAQVDIFIKSIRKEDKSVVKEYVFNINDLKNKLEITYPTLKEQDILDDLF